MLKRRLQAQQEIGYLWQTHQQRYTPLVDILAYATITYPNVIDAYLQKVKEEEPTQQKVQQAKQYTKQHDVKIISPDKDKKAIPLDSLHQTTPISSEFERELRVYRRLPRVLKPLYIEQLSVYWQNGTVILAQPEVAEQKSDQKLTPQQTASSSIKTTDKLSRTQQRCFTQLCRDVDASGWCYRQQQVTERWQQTLQGLFTTPPIPISSPEKRLPETKSAYPSVTLSFVLNGQVVIGNLHPAVVKQLLDDQQPANGKWRAKAKGISGRHHLLRVVLPKTEAQSEQVVWFKLNPEQPGTEYLVQQIDQRLGSFATPPQQLAKITVGNKPSMPVLISQEVAPPTLDFKTDQNLAQVLVHHPERLAVISPLSFVSTLLRVLIIQPEDDKPNDYFLLPDPDKPGYYLLVRIDNERAFFSPEHIASGLRTKRELNVKTIIFCLEQMTASWDELVKEDARLLDYHQHMQRLVPAECFQDILRAASDLHDQWCVLFSEQETQRLAQAGLAQGEIVFPLMMILPEYEKALLERLYLIQQSWVSGGVSGLPLLSNVQPELYAHYQPLFKPETDSLQRFAQGPGKLYQRDEQGQPRTTLSGLVSLSRQLNLTAILKLSNNSKAQQQSLGQLIQYIWRREQYSAAQALYGVGLWQQQKVLQIEQNLVITATAGVAEQKIARFSLTSLIQRQDKTHQSTSLPAPALPTHVITIKEAAKLRQSAQLQFTLLTIAERTQLIHRVTQQLLVKPREPKAQQLALQSLLTILAQAPVAHLSLITFQTALMDQQLIPILKCAGQHLLSLNISHCQQLTPDILNTIARYCPNLRHLRGHHLLWKNVTVAHHLHLTRLDFSQSHLQTLILSELPQLKQLRLRHCRQLMTICHRKQLVMTTRDINPDASIDQLLKLERLDINDCPALLNVQLMPVQSLDQIKLANQYAGCNPQLWINWLQFLYQQTQKADSPLFTLAKQALATSEKILDLSKLKLEKEELRYLYLLLALDLPITDLRLSIYGAIIYGTIEHKVVLLGGNNVGKSSLCDRFAKNTFNEYQQTTIGAAFLNGSIDIEGIRHIFQIWDTAGQECYNSLASLYYRNAAIGLVCFDSTDRGSFNRAKSGETAKFWIRELQHNASVNICIALAKCKIDLVSKCEVSTEEARDYAQDNGLPYFECSAKTGKGVNEILLSLANKSDKRLTRVSIPEAFTKNHSILKLTIGGRTINTESTYPAYPVERELARLLKRNCQAADSKKQPLSTPAITFTEAKTIIPTSTDSLHDSQLQPPLLSDIPEESDITLSELPTNLSHIAAEEKKLTPADKKVNTIDSKLTSPSEVKILPPKLPDHTPLNEPAQPLTEYHPDDHQRFIQLMQQLPPAMPGNSLTPWEDDLRNLQQHLPDEKTRANMQQLLKQICLSLQYQQRALRPSSQTKRKTALSPTQAYIQAHPELQQYHDLFLDTLEFSIKAAKLGVTGRLTMSNTTGTIVGGIGGAVGIVPGIGGVLKASFVAMELANKLSMRRQDDQISQLFKGGRDVEAQVAELAEQMTLAIRDELLNAQRTPQRQTVHEKSGVRGFYKRNKAWLSQKKTEVLNWQTLSIAQKQALVDADYLLTQLPALAVSQHYRGATANVATYLQKLMHDPDFHYDAEAVLGSLPDSPPKIETTDSTPLLPLLALQKHQYYTAKHQNYLATLHSQAQQPLTIDQWQALLVTLAELEVASLELRSQQDADEAEENLSQMLSDWFDRLQQLTPIIYQPTVSPEKPDTISTSTLLSPVPSSAPLTLQSVILPTKAETKSTPPPDKTTTIPTTGNSSPMPTLKTYLTQFLEKLTIPPISRRLKHYTHELLKTTPADDSNIPTRLSWVQNTIAALQQSKITQQLKSEEAGQLITYLQEFQTQYQLTNVHPNTDTSTPQSPSRSIASLFHPVHLPEGKLPVGAAPTPTQLSLIFNKATGRQMLKTLCHTHQSGALLFPHAQEVDTLRLILNHPEHSPRQYHLTYLNSGRWVIWTGKPGTYYPLLDKRADVLSADAQATLLPFITEQLPSLAKRCQFSELPTLLCPDDVVSAFNNTMTATTLQPIVATI